MPSFTGKESKGRYITVNLTDWSGGLNTSASPSNIADNELSVAENIVISSRGQIKKRKGLRRTNVAELLASPILFYGDPDIPGSNINLHIAAWGESQDE